MKTREFTTIAGGVIKVTPNNSKRTFTIRTGGAKYRTNRMDKDEFESAKKMIYSWTGNDWSQFLKWVQVYNNK